MEDKYLSIITNFGCYYKCPYCVVKNNNINIEPTTIESLDLLEEAIFHSNANIVSVSGGGDPLHEFQSHTKYYKRLFEILEKLNIPMEMHTSYVESLFPAEMCKKVVYHVHSLDGLQKIKRQGNEIVRAVFVVTEEMKESQLFLYAGYVKGSNNIDEISFRQLIDGNFESKFYLHDVLMKYHKTLWWYITQCDYNLYYVNGKVYTEYSKIWRINNNRYK